MKNSKLRRILMLMACAVLLVCLSVGATLAYLTSTTNIVENTFTVGNVSFDTDLNGGLDEADVNEYGELIYKVDEDGEFVLDDEGNKIPVERVTDNEYKLVPSHTYIKDPTTYIKAGSEPCYVFVNLENGMFDYLVDRDIEAQMEALGWTLLGGTGVYYYNGDKAVDAIVDARNGMVDLVIFETITLKANLNETQLEQAAQAHITIQAYAVQADGFTSPEDAWAKAPATWGEPESGEDTGA